LDGASPSFFGRFFALGKFVLNKTNSPKNKVLATFLGDFWRLLATFGDFRRLFSQPHHVTLNRTRLSDFGSDEKPEKSEMW
jgi:hypothetical protein